MAIDARHRPAVIECTNCGRRVAVVIWSHGTLEPRTGDDFCGCADAGWRIVRRDAETGE